ncbi:MAG: GMC family oxidoreductase N-terminal domain-containing protein [Acidobacteria bacterium]|nr:GMC family oxidoreductase N-terminal domain-containing protein [Acidobacteriota bacterium]
MKNFPTKEYLELLDSDLVTDETRRVLQERLNAEETPSRFFDERDFEILKAVCETLAPSRTVPGWFAAGEIDQRLAENSGNGWRYDSMPPDSESYKTGLRLLNETAQETFQNNFVALEIEERKDIFKRFESGKVELKGQSTFAPARFLEELFTEFAEIFYSHPLALEQIGYIGFADKHGWDLEVQSSKFKVQGQLEIQSSKFKAQSFPTIQNPKSKIQNQVDAVVIGTGAGGAPILARLTQAGLKVVALEAGKSFDYTKFATDEREQSKLFWTDERLSAGENAVAFGSNNSGCGVGGSTLHFTAYTPRPQPDDFRIFSDFGVGRDWCLSYEDLEPYFDELEWFLGVSGASPYPWGKPRRKGYPLPPLPLNGAAKLMQTACEKLNIKTAPAPNAALSQNYFQEKIGWRHACTNRGFCQAGCSTGAKGSMDVTFLPLAVYHGAEIRSECFVTEFEFDSNGEIEAVVYSQNGEIKKQLCKNVFLCAGGIETPRLLLINNLANSSGQIGKNFMAHTGAQIWGVFDEEIFPHKGIPGGLISEDTHRPKNANFAGGYLLQSIGVMPVTYVSQLARGEKIFGEELGGWMNDYNHTAGINILGDCLPNANNFMELADEKDARGLPKPRVYFSHGDNENQMTRHAEKLMKEIWTEAGAKKMWTFQRNAHVIGTCRMGTDASVSVVNENCRSFDIPNLYICDNSIFPSALSVNPALTIMALALKTADKFLESSKFKVQS